MINRCFLLAVVALQAVAANLQSPRDQKGQETRQNPIQLETQLVEVTAVITDKRGQPVAGLTKEDFELRENGKPQAISFFSAGSIGPNPDSSKPFTPEKPKATSEPTHAAPLRSVVILVDSLNMSAGSLLRSKPALHRFIDDKLTDSDMAAVVATSGNLGMLSQFTADKAILHYAIDRIGTWKTAAGTLFTPLLAARLLAGDTVAMNLGVAIVLREDHLEDIPQLDRAFLESFARNKAHSVITEAVFTRRAALLTLKSVIDRLSALPGQRIVAMLSEGFTLSDESGQKDFGLLQEATSRASRSGVVIYSVYAAGLEGPAIFDVSQRGLFTTRQTGNASDQATFTSYLSASKEDDKTVLRVLANDTGGGPLSESNDLLEALRKGLDANRVYYTLGYYPEDTGDLRKFRNISLKVRNHPDYSVRAQKGYQPSEIAKEANREQSLTPEQRLVKAMAEPLASTGLGVETSAYYYQREGDPTQLHLLTYVSGDGLDYRLENERYQFKLEVVIHIYDLKGRPAWSHSETVAGNLKAEHLDATRRNGISIAKQLAVPPGLYQIRLGVQEDSTGKIGTASCWVEVPDLAQKRMAMSSVVLGTDAGELRRNGPLSPDESSRMHTIKFFDKGDKLVYAFMLYHSPRDSNGVCPLEMQLAFVRGSQPIAETGWSPVASRQVSEDKLGILVAGELPLSDIKTGVYDLRVAIRDPKSKRILQNSVQFGID